MTQFDRSGLPLALILAGVAGFVDATAFITIGQFFAAFMSGNSTRLAVLVAESGWHQAGFAAGLIALFVAGAAIGHVVGEWAGVRRVPTVLMMQAVLLGIAAWLHRAGLGAYAPPLIVLAMGAANAVSIADGKLRFGVTSITAVLAQTGERLAAATRGTGKLAEVAPWLALWLALLGGGVTGAAAALHEGGSVVAIPASLLAGLALFLALRATRQSG